MKATTGFQPETATKTDNFAGEYFTPERICPPYWPSRPGCCPARRAANRDNLRHPPTVRFAGDDWRFFCRRRAIPPAPLDSPLFPGRNGAMPPPRVICVAAGAGIQVSSTALGCAEPQPTATREGLDPVTNTVAGPATLPASVGHLWDRRDHLAAALLPEPRPVFDRLAMPRSR